jgi:putative flippase GtrA
MRFALIGICNATISFGILNLAFYRFNQTKIVSSIIATSCALIFSFIMNRGFVFGDKTRRVHQQLPIFVIVTISGSLLVLNLVYILALNLLNGHEHLIIDSVKTLTSLSLTKNFVDINLSTVIGAVAALFWNYNGYKWFVFKGSKDAIEEAVEHTP